MNTFDFDKPLNRRDTNSYKWDSSSDPDMLPMWVADMDFETAPAVLKAIQHRALHGAFGYPRAPDAYYEAVTGWFKRRHRFVFPREHLIYTTGVVPALSAIIQALCAPGEGVIVQTPAYNCFFSSIRNSQCRQISSPLIYEDGKYLMDFDDLEEKAADPKNTMMLLCNPHNPVGRAWHADDLERVGHICLKHNVTVLSDEIHCDLIQPGYQHIPFAALNSEFMQISVTCSSPSKAFNLAGLQVSNILVADEEKRKRIDKQININEVCDISPFAAEALIAAYSEGDLWLDELCEYIAGNFAYLQDFLGEHLPQLKVPQLEATYLAWIDFSELAIPASEVTEILKRDYSLWLNEGTMYGDETDTFIRMNLATNRERVKEGLNRLKRAFDDNAFDLHLPSD